MCALVCVRVKRERERERERGGGDHPSQSSVPEAVFDGALDGFVPARDLKPHTAPHIAPCQLNLRVEKGGGREGGRDVQWW